MTQQLVDIPAWMDEVIAARAQALGVSYDLALTTSLDIGTGDVLAQSAGWAVTRIGERAIVVARRMAYSRSAINQAVQRYKRH